MISTEFEMISSNGKTALHCISWLPEREPRAVVQISHGVCSHVTRFAPLAEFLCAQGIAVFGHDHLGHGQSITCEEDRLFFAETGGWDFAIADLRQMTEHIRRAYPDKPLFLLGHSMGSFLARCYAIRFQDGIDGLMLSGTGQQPAALVRSGIALAEAEIRRNGPRMRSERLQGAMFGAYNRGIRPRRTDFDWISRDNAVVDRYMEDPECGGCVTAGLCRDMLGGIAYMSRLQNMKRMNKALPVYFFSGSEDPVGERGAGVFRAYTGFMKAGMQDVTLKLYTGGRHEMLNELNRDQVRGDLLAWMETKLPAAENG